MNRILLSLLAGTAALSMVSAVQAADLLIRQPSAPGYIDIGGSSGGWDGAYIGGFLGYGWGTALDGDADLIPSEEMDLSGWTAGVTLGANFTVAPGFILGAAGDIAWAGFGGYEAPADFDVNWTGSIRGRAGYDAGAFMPYVTAGLAFAGATASDGPNDSTQMHFGWTAGAGVEVAVADQVSLDLQYRYSDYGTADYNGVTNNPTIDLNTHAVTAGVNFKF